MKYTLIFLVIALMLSALGGYMMTAVINPLDEQKIDELVATKGIKTQEELYQELTILVSQGVIRDYLVPRRLAPVVAVLVLASGTWFIAVHTLIDKLFFKEFYKTANLKLALRRGTLLMLALTSTVLMRLLGIELGPSLIPLALAVVVELLIQSVIKAIRTARARNGGIIEE